MRVVIVSTTVRRCRSGSATSTACTATSGCSGTRGARARRPPATPAWPPARPTSSRSSTPTWCLAAAGWRRCSGTSAIPPWRWSRRGSSACANPRTWWRATRRCARRWTSVSARRPWFPTAPSPTCRVPPSSAAVGVLNDVGGFDETMIAGEDVDLCWRFIEAGARLRYEPIALVGHDHRTQLREWFVRKAFYGSSAAPLSVRHPGQDRAAGDLRVDAAGVGAAGDGLRRRLLRVDRRRRRSPDAGSPTR